VPIRTPNSSRAAAPRQGWAPHGPLRPQAGRASKRIRGRVR